MYKKRRSTYIPWENVEKTVKKYRDFDGKFFMGGVESLEAELAKVKEKLKFTEKCESEYVRYEIDKPIIEKIKIIRKSVDVQRSNKSFLSSIFGRSDEFNAELSVAAELEKNLNNKYGSGLEFKSIAGVEISLNQIRFAIKDLGDYVDLLVLSIEESKLRAKNRELKANESSTSKILKLHQQKEEGERTRALAAAHVGKTRQRATSIKQYLLDQVNILSCCPYCGGGLGATPHADHIYPVAKGGLSTSYNMVYVCQDCNKRKRDMTLIDFIQSSSVYDLNFVLDNLKKLHKKI